MPTGRFSRLCWAALVAAGAGCAGSRGDVDLLEARLRDQQDLLLRYERMLERQGKELTAARRESDLLRAQLADQHVAPLLPEHADVLLRAEKLAFHTLLTGTRDLDPEPGDDRLNVVLMPQAHTGEVVRLVGTIEIEALDLSRPEGRRQVARWTFTPEEARDNWHAGFLASGFQFELPWEDRTAGEVLLHARLTAPDGRQLDATHPLRLHSALARGKPTPPAAASPPPLVPVSSSTSRPAAPPPPPLAEAPLFPPAMPPLDSSSDRSAPAGPAAAATVPAPVLPAASASTVPVDPPRLTTEREVRAASPAEFPTIVPRPPAQASPASWLASEPPPPGRSETPPPEASGWQGEVAIHPLSEPVRPRRAEGASERAPQPLSPGPGFPQAEAASAAGGASPPPFPDLPPLRTSDRWTDESIPYLR